MDQNIDDMIKQPEHATERVLQFMVDANGLSATINTLRVICEKRSSVLSCNSTTEKHNAPKWSAAADILADAMNKIKYEINL
jgi:hypothetical protein